MLYANVDGLRRVPFSTGERGTCPGCGAAVIAKCGPIKIDHWAHEGRAECDPWSEPETPWHRRWKERFPAERQEVIVGPHRADVVTAHGWVLEFQHSPLSVEDIQAREDFYGDKLLWVLDGGAWARKNFHFRRTAKHGPETPRRTPATFRWKWPRKRWAHARRALFLDLGDEALLRVHWVSPDTPCGGWGTVVPMEAFLTWLETGTLESPGLPGSNPLDEILARQRARHDDGGPYAFDFDYDYETDSREEPLNDD